MCHMTKEDQVTEEKFHFLCGKLSRPQIAMQNLWHPEEINIKT